MNFLLTKLANKVLNKVNVVFYHLLLTDFQESGDLSHIMDNDNSTSVPLLAPGSYLRDRWEIIKKIGGGGFGEIYKAKDHAHEQVCEEIWLQCCRYH